MADLKTKFIVSASSQGGAAGTDASVGDALQGASGSTGQVLMKQSDGTALFETVLPAFVFSFSWSAGENPGDVPAVIAPVDIVLLSVTGRLEAAETAAATLWPVVAGSGTSLSAGATLTTGSFNAEGTATVNQALTLVAAPTIEAGQAIGLLPTGTFANSAGCVTFYAAATGQ